MELRHEPYTRAYYYERADGQRSQGFTAPGVARQWRDEGRLIFHVPHARSSDAVEFIGSEPPADAKRAREDVGLQVRRADPRPAILLVVSAAKRLDLRLSAGVEPQKAYTEFFDQFEAVLPDLRRAVS